MFTFLRYTEEETDSDIKEFLSRLLRLCAIKIDTLRLWAK